jgi:uncharacterized protein DUF2203
MRKQDHHRATTLRDPRLWTHAEAVRALPYLRAVLQSLHEHWLEMQQAWGQIRRLDARPGRRDRQALLLREDAGREAERAQAEFGETVRELTALGISGLDPAKGLVLLPFREGAAVAWFVFDLFAPQGQELSRFHANPSQTRRPSVERLDPWLVDEVFASGSLDVLAAPPGRP